MAIKNRSSLKKREIDLNGPEGNAFCLLGIAQNYAKDLGWKDSIKKQIQVEMTSGNYENLIKVFDKYFGAYVDLVREEVE